MRRPGHALRFSDVSDSGGDGRHSLASGGDGRSDERDRQHVERVIEKCWAKRGGVAGFERSVRSGPIYDALQRAVGRYGLLRYFDVVVATLGVLFLGLGLHAHNDLSLIHISEPRDQRGSRMPSSA